MTLEMACCCWLDLDQWWLCREALGRWPECRHSFSGKWQNYILNENYLKGLKVVKTTELPWSLHPNQKAELRTAGADFRGGGGREKIEHCQTGQESAIDPCPVQLKLNQDYNVQDFIDVHLHRYTASLPDATPRWSRNLWPQMTCCLSIGK